MRVNPSPSVDDSIINCLYVWTEAHVEKTITFIQDEVFDSGEIDVILVRVDEALNICHFTAQFYIALKKITLRRPTVQLRI